MTMKRFAVGFFSLHSNELDVEILEGETWRHATIKHSKSLWQDLEEPDIDESEDPEDARNEIPEIVPETLEEAKRDAFDQDGAFDCVEIK